MEYVFWENFERRGEFIKKEYPCADTLACSGTQRKAKEEKQRDDEMEERNAEQCSSSTLCNMKLGTQVKSYLYFVKLFNFLKFHIPNDSKLMISFCNINT